jgi:SAM-dependent methyltransferase
MPLVILPGAQHVEEDFELDPEVLAGLWHMEEHHFWHAARNRFIARALAAAGARPPAVVLDVGCGGGAVACALHGLGYHVVGIDTGEPLVRKAFERCPAATFVAGRVEDLSGYGPFDVITCLDVLEHLNDPLSLLSAALKHARPGALVVATVPALMELYSVVDELSGHKKRYEAGELGALFERAGLVGIEERGIFRAILPFMRLHRKQTYDAAPRDRESRRRVLLADAHVPAFPVNVALKALCSAEARFAWRAARGRRAPSILATARVKEAA